MRDEWIFAGKIAKLRAVWWKREVAMSIKVRNRLIALFCLGVFVAGGAFLYTNWVVQKPFGLILFVGDGLTTGQLAAARIYKGGGEAPLNLERLRNVALLRTCANDFAVPDAAAAASAIATGVKVNNRNLSINAAGEPLESLVDVARTAGRATGLVSNVAVTDATAAAFYAHSDNPLDHDGIAKSLQEGAKFDVILGGGEADFLPDSKGGRRTDGADLILELRRQGFDVVRSQAELDDTPAWRAPRVFGLFSEGNLQFAISPDRPESQPTLSAMVQRAIELLQCNQKGYLLVVDAGLIAKASHNNEGEGMLREILELDAAIGAAIEYAGDNTLIVACGKQSIGGFRLNGYPFKNDRGVSILGKNAQGIPFITWSTGPGGVDVANPDAPPVVEPAAVAAPAAIGVAEDTIAAGRGPGSESLRGFDDNTSIFKVFKRQM